MFDIIVFAVLIFIGFFIGSRNEKNHYKALREKEVRFQYLPVVTFKSLPEGRPEIEKAEMVSGNVVISSDFFKTFVAGLKTIFGGTLTSYETLVDRARREAIVRLKEKAGTADIVLNLRVESTRITDQGSAEAFAYGTAIYYKK